MSVRRALENAPAALKGARTAFCDFAAGGDENVLAVLEGNRTWIEKAWRDENTFQAIREFISLFGSLGLTPSNIYADNTGMGTPMVKHLAEEGWYVNPVENGSVADKSEVYSNRGAEIWFEAAIKIERCEVILPNDPLCIQQLTRRRREYDGKQRLRAESKEAMRARGIRSPDRADALCGAIACSLIPTGAFTPATVAMSHVPTNPFSVPHIRF
jgi:phage terminase large subunit